MKNKDTDLRCAINLTVAAVRLTRWLRLSDERPQLTPAQASAMAVIIHSGGVTPSQLAEYEQVSRPTISRVIEELERLGAIARCAHPEDQRSTVLNVTPLGRQIWERGQERRARPLAARIAELSPGEWSRVEEMIDLMMALPDLPTQPATRRG